MSTYYMLICEEHKEKTDALSKGAGGIGALCDSNETLLPFLYSHCGCSLKVVSEHHDEAYSEEYKEWTSNNVEEMIERSKSFNH